MPKIENGIAPTFTHGPSRYHEASQANDMNESEPYPLSPLRYHRSSSSTHTYSESNFTCQFTERGSSYGQDNPKDAEPRIEATHNQDNLKEAEPRTEATPNQDNPEEAEPQAEATPKGVLRTGWLRFIQSWLVHAPAVLSTILVVYIGSKRVFWFPEQGPSIGGNQASPSTIINLLQVAAKIHEIMMVLSLSAIILAIYRRRLIGNGVRLGFLTAGYRVGDLKYLLSSSFWHQGSNEPWEILLCGLLVFATVMSAIVGPASAVLLTPSLDWFEFDPDTAFSKMKSPLTYYGPDDVWPSHLTANPANIANVEMCRTPYGLYAHDCPARGFREMNQWVREWEATNLTTPILFQAISSDISRRLEVKTDLDRSVALSTTPSEFLLNSIGFFRDYIAAGDVGAVSGNQWPRRVRYRLNTTGSATQGNITSAKLLQPLVQSKCQIYERSDFLAKKEVLYPTEGLDCMGDSDCESGCASPRRLQPNNTRFKDNRTNSDVTDYLVDAASSSVVYLSGQISHLGDDSDQNENKVYLCSLVASWMPAKYTFDPVKSNVLQSTLWSDEVMEDIGRDKSTGRIVVKFTDPWLMLLNPWIIQKNGSIKWSALDALTSHFKVIDNAPVHPPEVPVEGRNNNTAKEIYLATAVGAYLAEALARTSSSGYTLVKLAETDTNLSFATLNYKSPNRNQTVTTINTTHLKNEATGKVLRDNLTTYDKGLFNQSLPILLAAERYGYGTGQPRKTLHFAQAMLAIYLGAVCLYAAAMAAGHVLAHLGARDRIPSVTAWPDQQDLLLVTLRTPAPGPGGDLDDVGAGVTWHDVWKKIVRVRVDDRNHVQIVMGDDEAQGMRPLGRTGKERYY